LPTNGVVISQNLVASDASSWHAKMRMVMRHKEHVLADRDPHGRHATRRKLWSGSRTARRGVSSAEARG